MSSAWSYRRMKRLFPPKPLVKPGSVEDRHLLKVPQFVGTPGWLSLTHNESGDPIAMFVDSHERIDIVYVVLDERVFSDTLLRVVKLGPWRYVVYDMPVLNGRSLHETLSYRQRQEKLTEVLDVFHFPDLIALETPDQIPLWDTPVRGYEHYDETPGTLGVFCPVKE
jgi:hypothetical protein